MSYSKSEVLARTNVYFDGDELAPDVFMKYALRDVDDNILEADPDMMHTRLAKEFARIEAKGTSSSTNCAPCAAYIASVRS